ncbi:MAG: hypothetical protein A2992_06480 [Elusimicrobia bacterium RIFCSPLOWO2_01_FULL_59_12]|nr:MAG: hypothetical protein A2992_06480 [Elusimicrobia bacterium RIFCSPLOWO2_01_FULL_59_12]
MLQRKKVEAFEKWEVELAEGKARGLIGKYGFTEGDRPDIKQELLLHIHLSRGAQAGWERSTASERTTLSRILDNRIRDLIDAAQSDKRKVRSVSESIERHVDAAPDESILTQESFLHEEKGLGRIGRKPFALEEETRIAVGLVVRKLTTFQKRILSLLWAGHNVSETAKALRMKRTTLNREIDRLRRIFYRRGLGDYI